MLRGFRWVALMAVVLTAALVGPSAALACSGSSATNIYSEGLCDGTGKKHSTSPKRPTKSSGSSQPTQTTQTPWVAPQPVQVSTKTKHVLAHSGKDKRILTNIVRNPRLVGPQHLNVVRTSSPTEPTALGSAVDLGSGPTLLFALLAATLLVALGTGGVRTWRNRHRV